MVLPSKLLNLALVLTSLVGYLEWGNGSSTFLFQAEVEIFSKLISDPAAAIHPFTLLPLLGQILLLVTLFQKQPNKIPTFIGLGSIGLLLVFMFVIGMISMNLKILFSTLPFLLVGILTIRYYWRRQQEEGSRE